MAQHISPKYIYEVKVTQEGPSGEVSTTKWSRGSATSALLSLAQVIEHAENSGTDIWYPRVHRVEIEFSANI